MTMRGLRRPDRNGSAGSSSRANDNNNNIDEAAATTLIDPQRPAAAFFPSQPQIHGSHQHGRGGGENG